MCRRLHFRNQHPSLKGGTQEQGFYSLAETEKSACSGLLFLDAPQTRMFLLLTLVLFVFTDHSHGNIYILYYQTENIITKPTLKDCLCVCVSVLRCSWGWQHIGWRYVILICSDSLYVHYCTKFNMSVLVCWAASSIGELLSTTSTIRTPRQGNSRCKCPGRNTHIFSNLNNVSCELFDSIICLPYCVPQRD